MCSQGLIDGDYQMRKVVGGDSSCANCKSYSQFAALSHELCHKIASPTTHYIILMWLLRIIGFLLSLAKWFLVWFLSCFLRWCLHLIHGGFKRYLGAAFLSSMVRSSTSTQDQSAGRLLTYYSSFDKEAKMKKLSSRAGAAAARWDGTEPAAATHQDHHATEAEKASSSADEHVSPLLSVVAEDKNSVWQENSQIKDRYVLTCSHNLHHRHLLLVVICLGRVLDDPGKWKSSEWRSSSHHQFTHGNHFSFFAGRGLCMNTQKSWRHKCRPFSLGRLWCRSETPDSLQLSWNPSSETHANHNLAQKPWLQQFATWSWTWDCCHHLHQHQQRRIQIRCRIDARAVWWNYLLQLQHHQDYNHQEQITTLKTRWCRASISHTMPWFTWQLRKLREGFIWCLWVTKWKDVWGPVSSGRGTILRWPRRTRQSGRLGIVPIWEHWRKAA